jgi:putative multicomponent Na+:H+ antiporter subunit B
MNSPDFYIYAIIALLPLAAAMLVFQSNPYHALVIRGILGAIAALVYAILGAADVALTEALMGTLLAITLYAIAIRSSLVMRLGVLEDQVLELADLRAMLSKRHMRLELVTYTDKSDLNQALLDREVHAICDRDQHTTTRIQRLYELMRTELALWDVKLFQEAKG